VPDLGVRFEDGLNAKQNWSFVDPTVLKKEIEERKANERTEKLKKLTNTEERLKKEKADLQYVINVSTVQEYFKKPEYTQWDSEGFPTHDNQGKDISKGKATKIRQEWNRYKAKREKTLKTLETSPDLLKQKDADIEKAEKQLKEFN